MHIYAQVSAPFNKCIGRNIRAYMYAQVCLYIDIPVLAYAQIPVAFYWHKCDKTCDTVTPIL